MRGTGTNVCHHQLRGFVCQVERQRVLNVLFILKSLFVDAAHVAGAKLVITSQVL